MLPDRPQGHKEWRPDSEATPDRHDEWAPAGAPEVLAAPGGPGGSEWLDVPQGSSPGALPVGARKPRGTLGWDIMLGIDLGLLGLNLILAAGLYVMFLVSGEDATSLVDTGSGAQAEFNLWFGISANLVMMGIIPLVWVAGTRVGGWSGVAEYLHFRKPENMVWGPVLAVGLVAIALGVSLALAALGLDETTPNIEALLAGLTWPLVFFISAVAGFAEEVLFRGVIQRWTGWIGQAVIFGAFHIANGFVAFFVTFAIGLLFGYIVKRGHGLWVVIAAHFVYDVILLSLALMFPELGT